MLNNDKRIRVIIGHYGSGKSEFSVNYAVKLAQMGKKVALADLDIVNMYFRSREKALEMEGVGIKVIGSQINAPAIEVPSISAEVYTPLQDESYNLILDVGGDQVGARALGRYVEYFEEGKYDMFFVLNANRPETQTVDKVLEYMTKIQDVSRAKITGIINNTHLLKSTTYEDVLRGQQLALEVQERTGIKLKYISVLEEVIPSLPNNLEGEIFPIKLFMRDEWML
ncbi:ATP-binding protein [Tissierella pigra]|uniref:ATP-binding protein n=1 Tax=Tissierella pigra TaxID=2607614 RepID=A0A6N7XHG6_9FIRM|nr:ATP-binding protein [Tissierella pigra]MBU5425761.1 ATP-binding protein [Tissierella pigra]MSU01501.1 ATP-binding protein [Tissierella pigra]